MSFLTKNIKLIVHLRQRLHQDTMMGLCIGAGVSADFSLPTWPELLSQIAKHPDIKGEGLLKISQSLTSQCQFLFQKYKQTLQNRGDLSGDEFVVDRQAQLRWMGIVHETLYENAKVSDDDLQRHPYLKKLVPLIKRSALTVNYNFDDCIERLIYLDNKNQNINIDDKGFEIVWQPSSQFRRSKGVIYHPNGFLPQRPTDGASEHIVFMEQEFSDQLIDVNGGHYACLLNHLSKNTLLFLGLSLSDATLKHLLRISARNNPGSFHYHIHWCENNMPPPEEQKAIQAANFSVYNLVTFFLNTDEIHSLVNHLMMDEEAFRAACDAEPDGVNTQYRYYLTGVVGAGKSTTLENVKCFESFDEWVDRKNPLLVRPHEELSGIERSEVDSWINSQFRKKNRRVTNTLKQISIVDRSPLDPLYFVSDPEAMAQRSSELLNAMVPANSDISKIAAGHLIILTCHPSILTTRLANRQKVYNEKQVQTQSEVIADFWDGHEVTIIDTTNLPSQTVVRKVLEAVVFDEYSAVDFQTLCESLAGKGQ